MSQVYFKDLQQINLQRLHPVTKDQLVTPEELAYVREVAASKTPAAGYAQGLYRVLTGIKLDIDFPLVNLEEPLHPKRISVSTNNQDQLMIQPNPASGAVQVQLLKSSIKSIILYNGHGSVVKSLATNANKVNLDLSAYASGIYFVKITSIEGLVYNEKIIKK